SFLAFCPPAAPGCRTSPAPAAAVAATACLLLISRLRVHLAYCPFRGPDLETKGADHGRILDCRNSPGSRSAGHHREFDLPTPEALPHDPAVAPKGSLWFTDQKTPSRRLRTDLRGSSRRHASGSGTPSMLSSSYASIEPATFSSICW